MKKNLLFGFVLCAVSVAGLCVESGAAVFAQDVSRASVYYRDGARFALEGRLVEAVAAFEQAVALDPKNGDAHYSLGNVYAELGRLDDAVAAYRKAVSLNKNDLEAYNGLGLALARRGVYVQAASAFERAVEIYPKWAEPHFHLSEVYKQLGKDEKAREAYRDALRLRPDYAARPPNTLMTARAGTPAEMTPAPVESVTASQPSTVRPPAEAATRRADDNAGANKAVDESARRAAPLDTSGDAREYRELGLKLGRAGRHEEAVTALRKAVVIYRNDAGAYLALGDEYAALRRWRESVDAYEQAARLDPKHAETFERLGRAYAKLREEAQAAAGGDGESAVGARASAPGGASGDTASRRGKERAPETGDRDAGKTTAGNAATGERASGPGVAASNDADPTAVYRVGAGDVLDVRVLNRREPKAAAAATTAYKVTPAGLLDYPRLAEPLPVVGLTTDEIAARLGSELKRRAVATDAAEVAVAVLEYESHAIIISGLVKDPGTKIMRREGVPLYVIIAYAQPLPEAGRVLVVSRVMGRSTTFELADALSLNTLVRPGDVITVQARAKQYFYVVGAVLAPGQKEFHGGLTLTQAVLAAGGVTQPGVSLVTVARQGADGRLLSERYDLREIGAGRTPDPRVEPGDRIEVLR